MNAAATLLPPDIRPLTRGWLSANHVALLGDGRAWLVDTGHVARADETVALLRGDPALAGRPLERVLNTHCHVDHAGGNARLQDEFGCPVFVPEKTEFEEPLAKSAGLQMQPFRPEGLLRDGDSLRFGGREWVVVEAPGHDMTAVMFFCPELGVLISGDALWEGTTGFLIPGTDDAETDRTFEAALCTLDIIEDLGAGVVIPGHGRVFGDVPASLLAARKKVDALAADRHRMAWLAAKAMVCFTLLENGGLTAQALGEHVRAVPFYADMDRRGYAMGEALADSLLKDLQAARAVTLKGEKYHCTLPA